jgi:hypothetical protein
MERARLIVSTMWRWFRRRSLFMQSLLVVPVFCAILLAATVGNMGLAFMGGAIGISALAAGWLGGVAMLIFWKAGVIVAKDRRRSK